MDSAGINGVLHEALTLAQHAARTGALPANSKIFDQIEAVTQARDRGERPDIAPLVAEMMRVSAAARITVAQLMRRSSALGRLRHGADAVTPFLVGIMTLLLTLYLAFQSSELHKADLALREYQELVTEHLQEKIYLAWKMYRYERVLNLKGPVLAQLDGYQKLVDDAKRLYVKRDAVQQMLLDTAVIRYVPQLFQYHGPCWLQSVARTLNADSSVACRDTSTAAGAGAALAPAGLLPEYVPDGKTSDKKAAFDCSINHTPPGAADKVSDTAMLSDTRLDLDDYVQSVSCFVRSLNIAAYDEPVDRQIYATRTKVHLLVSWLLPGLYGLLGACVFVMRALLRTTGRRAGAGDARIVDMLSLLLRVSLGGLAGIIIGWFSVPTASSAGTSAIAVSSIPFGMAFLAGYSIESLFSMLDRLNKTLGQQDDGAGQKGVDGPKPPAGAPPSPAAPAEPPVASVLSVAPPAPPPVALPAAPPDASAAAQGKT